MNDRHAEGIEKAAEELFYLSDIGGAARAHWETVITEARDYYRTRSRASITVYLEHAFPEVTSAEELDALPVGAVVLLTSEDGCTAIHEQNGAGWATTGLAEVWSSQALLDEPCTARVIHWPDHA